MNPMIRALTALVLVLPTLGVIAPKAAHADGEAACREHVYEFERKLGTSAEAATKIAHEVCDPKK